MVIGLSGVQFGLKSYRLGQLSQKWTFVGKFEEKLGNTLF